MEMIKNIFRNHKSKIVLFFVSILAFVFLFFPYDDLSDLVSEQVANATNNSLYIEFEDLGLGFLPQPGIKMSNVMAEHPLTGEIRADVIKAAPSILAFLKQLPLLRLKAENLFKGNLDVTTSPAKTLKDPMAINAEVDFTNFDLNSLVKALVPIPMKANGTMSLNALLDVDMEMKGQPDGEVMLTSPKVDIPAFSIDINTPTANGTNVKQTIGIPTLNLGKVQIKGKIKNGTLTFADSVIGSDKDSLFAKIGGNISIRATPGGIVPTYYDVQLDITMKKALLDSLGAYAGMIEFMVGKYSEKASNDSKRYKFRLQMNPAVDMAPNFAPYTAGY